MSEDFPRTDDLYEAVNRSRHTAAPVGEGYLTLQSLSAPNGLSHVDGALWAWGFLTRPSSAAGVVSGAYATRPSSAVGGALGASSEFMPHASLDRLTSCSDILNVLSSHAAVPNNEAIATGPQLPGFEDVSESASGLTGPRTRGALPTSSAAAFEAQCQPADSQEHEQQEALSVPLSSSQRIEPGDQIWSQPTSPVHARIDAHEEAMRAMALIQEQSVAVMSVGSARAGLTEMPTHTATTSSEASEAQRRAAMGTIPEVVAEELHALGAAAGVPQASDASAEQTELFKQRVAQHLSNETDLEADVEISRMCKDNSRLREHLQRWLAMDELLHEKVTLA
eukprot:CAMPEP_0117607938 /NCGR_PEP_ID=MMETSP0784-20121206/80542_1 /TAXON_ID=39447 /ORGANISM="" /LENGTH=337 /DNA_ID=CAMNT_0005411179 /DNA_START=111 /DNA_END=1125 /DNA_ORIENTATION=-